MAKCKKVVSLILVAFLLFSAVFFSASAAEPEAVAPLASDYINAYSGWMSQYSGSKNLSVNFTVVGTDIMDLIGVRMIIVYYSTDNENWTIQSIYRYDDYPSLMKAKRASWTTGIDVTGTYGYYYKAYLVFRSELDGGYDERAIYTRPIYVSRFV